MLSISNLFFRRIEKKNSKQGNENVSKFQTRWAHKMIESINIYSAKKEKKNERK